MSSNLSTHPIYWFVAEVDSNNAGFRVRTLPLVAELRNQGVAVEVRPTGELPAAVKDVGSAAAAVVVSKPSDTPSALCMARFAALGVPVVVDLFDNYFSWSPALARRQLHWQWMRALKSASLILSSSDYLRHVIASLTDKPVIQVGDMVPRPPPERLGTTHLERKWRSPQRLELLWFGIAGNPYFNAGLEDLARWIPMVRDLTHHLAGHAAVHLTICTNRVPAVDAVLHALRVQQVQARFIEWSESVCGRLLEESHVVLLPTNVSGFSLSKTHNRCSDALAQGCLVLASPQGPYLGLGGAVFDDPGALASALTGISAEGVRQLVLHSYAQLNSRHDIVADVRRFRQQLARLAAAPAPPPAPKQAPRVLITARSKAEVAKFSRTLGYLVGGFSDGALALNYDFRLESMELYGGTIAVTLSERALATVEDILEREVDFDVDERDGWVNYRVGPWQLRLERSQLRLLVVKGLPVDVVRKLADAQAVGRRSSPAQQAVWFEAHVDVLTRVLWRLGLRAMDFATEEDDGWQCFADNADPDLARLAARLRKNWIRFAGRELAWGRPKGVAA